MGLLWKGKGDSWIDLRYFGEWNGAEAGGIIVTLLQNKPTSS